MWLAVNKDREFRIFKHKPIRYKKPVKVESDELDEDHHGHFYRPMVNSGEYEDIWAIQTNHYFDFYDYGDPIKNIDIFSDIIKNMTWEDEPVEL